MKNFETLAQEVWAAKSIGEKKTILVEMVMDFTHKDKTTTFLQTIANLTSLSKADKLAADICLRDKDRVVS
jgi:hypothetical protein|tara:strand:+ start:535 stop:747 length:213 start_codon:yes stop_codon:yes gene_type:complete